MRIPAAAWLSVMIAAGCAHEAAAPPVVVPPSPPTPAVATCAQVASHARDLVEAAQESDEVVGRMTTTTLERCTADNWNDAMRRCVMATTDLEAGHHCLDKLPEAQRTAFLAAARGDHEEPDAAPKPPVVSTLPQECIDYRAKMDAYFDCPAIPDNTRQQGKASLAEAFAAWETLPDEGRATLAAGCKQALDAVSALACP